MGLRPSQRCMLKYESSAGGKVSISSQSECDNLTTNSIEGLERYLSLTLAPRRWKRAGLTGVSGPHVEKDGF